MLNFFKILQINLLSIILILPSVSFCDEVKEVNEVQLPPNAVQVTPEEFKELKKEEVSKPSGTTPSGSFTYYGGGGGDGAILIFAIVGTIVLIAWVPYIVVLLYRGLRHPEKYKYHSLVNIQYNRLTKSSYIHREGYMAAFKYTPYISDNPSNQNPKPGKPKNYGLNFEIGKYHFNDFDELLKAKQKYDSYYWLLGPSMIFGNLEKTNRLLFGKIDFLAGTSFKRDVNLILRADISINYVVKNGLLFGLGVGGSYLNGQKGQGIISHSSDLTQHWFFTSGFLF